MQKLLFCGVFTAIVAATVPAYALYGDGRGVGLGVAGGVAYSNSKLNTGTPDQSVGARFAWGFFVDIPLLTTFYITPSTMIYDLEVDGVKHPVTDVDLNFKFIVPMDRLALGAGVTTGLTTGLDRSYVPHWGLLAQLSFNLVANLDAFVLAQYKKNMRDGTDIADIHAYAGGMFHF